jgi:DMSO/TMAO reductase YedYZ molybdopterin-dependent catalytic subunit
MRRPQESDFTAPAHDPRVTARIGLWLGVTFTVCFVTGLLSHLIQHPPGWFAWPTRPVALYRVTQGLHVLAGVASVPLLLAKLWTVYPKLFTRPAVRSPAHAVERLSLLVLIGAAFFELVTGLFNVAQAYPWRFFFPTAHYAVGWIAIGSVIVHIGLKLPVIRAALGASPGPTSGSGPAETDGEPEPADAAGPGRAHALGRRGFLTAAALASGAVVVATAGATVPWLRRVSVLAWSSGTGPQGLPVNRTAVAAGVTVDPDWQLEVSWPGGSRRLGLAELSALPQRMAELPIACVEGWSATATWTGVSMPVLLAAVGAPTGHDVRVRSLERDGLYSGSVLPARHATDELTLLALRIGDEPLHLDHGFPARIIAPSRPGVLQTKWVRHLEVLA